MKKLVLFLLITSLLLGCASASATPDASAIFTQAVATAYDDITKNPPSAEEPPLLIRTLENANLTELAWSPDGQAIASAACRETCQLNLYTLDLSQVWSAEVKGTVSYMDYSPDGKLIAALVKNGIKSRDVNGKILEADQTEIWLFNAQDGVFLRKWDVEQAVMLRFEPSGKRIATAGGSVIFWDLNTGAEFWRLNPRPMANQLGSAKLASLSLSPMYGGGPWCNIQTYDTVSFSPDSPILIVSGDGVGLLGMSPASEWPKCYSVQGWDLVQNRGLSYNSILTASSSEEFPVPQQFALQVTEVSVSRFSELLVSGLLVMNSGFYPATPSLSFLFQEQPLDQPQFSVAENWGLDFAALTMTGAAISPSAERAAGWGQTLDTPPAYFLNLFDVRTSQQIAEVQKGSDPALSTFSAVFSPDSRILASIDQSGNLKLWKVRKILP